MIRHVMALVAGLFLLASCGDGERHAIGGNVAGLSGPGLVLSLNGKETLPITANGAFTFDRKLADGASYNVLVEAHPIGQGCTVAAATGSVSAADITDIVVTCNVAAPLAVVSSVPAGGATGVSRTSNASFTFSAALGAATVKPANVQLTGVAGTHAIAVSSSGAMLEVAPSGKLLPLAAYSLVAGTGVRGANGEQLASPAGISFTTRDGAWQEPEVLSGEDARFAAYGQVAMDQQGGAVAVWLEDDGRTHAYSSSYVPGEGWSRPEEVARTDALPRDLKVDAKGNAMAVWEESSTANCGEENDCSRYTVKVRRYRPGHGWSKATDVATSVGYGSMQPRLAMDAAGNAVIAWRQWSGSRTNLVARRYLPQDGWSESHFVEEADGNVEYPSVAMDAGGNAIVVWTQFDGSRSNLWSSRHSMAGGWSEPVLVETDDAGSAWQSRVAADAAGNAVAVWMQSDGARYNVWANRYAAGAGWGAAQLIETHNAGDVLELDLAMDARGNVVATWSEIDRARTGPFSDVWASRYVADVGWEGATRMEDDDTHSASSPQAGMDAAGNALVAWSQGDAAGANLWSRRLPAVGAWGAPVLIEAGNSTEAGNAPLWELAVGGTGDAIAMWSRADGQRLKLHAARFE